MFEVNDIWDPNGMETGEADILRVKPEKLMTWNGFVSPS